MVLDGGAYVPQPYYAFVQLYMNGQDLILTNNRPQHLISFTHTMETNAIASWSVELFDATFNLIEHDIWEQSTAGKRPILKFKYGYSPSGVESPYYYSELAKVTPTWGYSGVTLRLEGTHVPGQNQNIPTIWYKRDRAFVDMKISEIVKKLCLENGYVIDYDHFDETEPILLPHDLNSTNPISKIFEQKGMSMEQFIKHCLLPYAVKEGTKQGGYVLFIDHRTDPAKVRFYVPDKGPDMTCPGGIKREYTIRQDKMEEWVDFSYDLGYGPKEATGIFEEAHFSIDPTTGEYVFEKYNVDNQREFMRLYGQAYRRPQFTDEKNNVRMRPSHAPAILEDERKFFHRNHLIRKLRGKAMTATLTIVGDPRDDVLPGDFIYIHNMLPDGSPHYSTGCYLINKITHQITGGTYTTTFDVSRNAAPQEPSTKDSSEHPVGNTSQTGGGF